MPVEVTAASSAPVAVEIDSSAQFPSQVRKRRRNSSTAKWLAFALILLLIASAGVLKIIGNQMMEQGGTRSSYKEGYRDGHSSGRSSRNSGGSPNLKASLYAHTAKDVSAQSLLMHTYELPYELKDGMPKRGTREYGDYTLGFEEGFWAGYNGN